MTDIEGDKLYNPSIQITSAPATTVTLSPQNDVFSQRLQAANSQHLHASNTQTPLPTIPPRERSPFRQGSPLAPTSPEQTISKTVSPKDVDLVYHESEEDAPPSPIQQQNPSLHYGNMATARRESKKPSGTAADTGTYTCTYDGCTLRLDTPAELQRHKSDSHRTLAAAINGGDRTSQAGPHKVRTASKLH